MNKHIMLYKTLVIAIFVLFIGAGFSPVIGRSFNSEQDVYSMTFYTFGRTGTKKCKVELNNDIAEEISSMFKDLKNKLTCEPTSDQTFELKNDFVDMLDVNGLIPVGLSRDYVFSLLNPRWLNWFGGNSPFIRNGFLSSLGSRLKNSYDSGSFSNTGSAFFCSMAGGGFGLMFPPVMIPRPRIATVWSSFLTADIIAANLYTGHGFSASGSQFGVALGFLGIGLSFAIPGQPAYFGFGGYSLFTMVGADEIVTYPLNRAPVVSEETPSDGSRDVSLSLSELSFRIRDLDGDRMDYSITTDPDIGSDSGFNKGDGRYSVSVSDLDPDISYSWTVRVSDGESVFEERYRFTTVERPPFDPFDEDWQYRKKITVDHSKVAGDLSGFPVLINVVDSDLKNKAQSDGDDILFMEGSGVANKLSHEIERFDDDSGTLVAWVCIHSLFGSVDTDFYMYYGNSECSNQEKVNSVWDSDYEMVQHMHGSSYSEIDDSTSNNNDIVGEGGNPTYQYTASDIVGYAVDFDGDGDWIRFADGVKGDFPATWELYLDSDSISGIQMRIVDSGGGDGARRGIIFWMTTDSRWGIWAKEPDSGSNLNFIDGYHSATTDKTYLALKWSGTGSNGYIFKDGGNKITLFPKDKKSGNLLDLTIGGGIPGIEQYFDGRVDELRISNIVRSDDWIKTSYNTMKYGFDGGFLSIGPEEPGP